MLVGIMMIDSGPIFPGFYIAVAGLVVMIGTAAYSGFCPLYTKKRDKPRKQGPPLYQQIRKAKKKVAARDANTNNDPSAPAL